MNTSNQFSGGRYRSLSVVTFAIEEQLLGKDTDENPALGKSLLRLGNLVFGGTSRTCIKFRF